MGMARLKNGITPLTSLLWNGRKGSPRSPSPPIVPSSREHISNVYMHTIDQFTRPCELYLIRTSRSWPRVAWSFGSEISKASLGAPSCSTVTDRDAIVQECG